MNFVNIECQLVCLKFQTGYSKYETGENDLPTSILIKLARFYDTSINYLLNETDNPKRYS